MTKCFTGIEIPEIKNDYLHRKEVLEYVMKKALETNFYKLSEPESCKIALEEYKEFTDPTRQFWSEFENGQAFVWNLLPWNFLYDLFVSWSKKNNPSGSPAGKNTFMADLKSIIASDPSFNVPKDKVRVSKKSNMDEPEPLILEYGLDDWKNKVYRGSNKLMLAKIDPADRYYGIVRLSLSNVSSESDNEE